MEPLRDDQLIADLQALRPTPRPQFAAELDERVAAGFPRRSRLSLNRLQAIQPRRLWIPAGAVALVAIAVGTALVATKGSESNSQAPVAISRPAQTPHPEKQVGGATQASAAEEAGSTQFEAELPNIPSAGAAAQPNLHHRVVEQSAAIVLGAAPDDVADDAAKVFETVHANNGIVMRSSTQQGKAGEAGATFDLRIPSAKLGDALAAFSQIDAVRSRHEATADITHPTVTAAELLRESRARIDSLLGQLEAAELESEREAVEAELRHERRHAARLAAQLSHLHRRADFSRVSLRIETGATEEPSSGGGAWGIDDALHDAGHVLTVVAAITLIALAVLGPIALIALLAWLTHRAWVRRERRRVLS